jgi:hypothetical protein
VGIKGKHLPHAVVGLTPHHPPTLLLIMRSSLIAGLVGVSTVGAVKPLVDVSYSKYQGVSLDNGVTQWLGVRYAAPPVGDLRFAAPCDPVKNKTTIIADTVSTCNGNISLASLLTTQCTAPKLLSGYWLCTQQRLI